MHGIGSAPDGTTGRDPVESNLRLATISQARTKYEETKTKLDEAQKDLGDLYVQKSKYDTVEQLQAQMQDEFEKRMLNEMTVSPDAVAPRPAPHAEHWCVQDYASLRGTSSFDTYSTGLED